MSNQLFATKNLKALLAEAHGDNRLKRVLGPVTLTSLGVGAVIGAGIFVATGPAAKEVAGPALMVSYMVAGIACIFAALCYAEFASMAPVAGSAYTYAYCTMGELFAWIIGWDLVLEYAVGAATVANGWSGYFQTVLLKLGIAIPIVVAGAPYKYDQGHYLPNVEADYQGAKVTQAYVDEKEAGWLDGNVRPAKGIFWVKKKKAWAHKQEEKLVMDGMVGDENVEARLKDVPNSKKEKITVMVGPVGEPAIEKEITNLQHAIVNLPAIIIALIVTAVLVKGISESAGFNALMVFIKLAAVLFVIVVGLFYIHRANYDPFAPYGWTGLSFFGYPMAGQTNAKGDPVGMLAGAAIIFFAYIGFDSVSTHAEEARNPQRDVPIGIVASLIICTILYVAVVAVLTGMVRFSDLDKEAGVSDAFYKAGLPWADAIIATAGVAGITSVLLVMMLSGPRVFLAMARDGLVPKKFFADVHPVFRTPWKSTIAIGLFVSLLTGLLPIDALLHLTNIGTLFAFVIVCGAVLIMRKTNPDAVRPFRCPLVPVVPVLGIALCLLLMLSLPPANWWRLIGWLAIGLVIYFSYGMWHSTLGKELATGQAPGSTSTGGHG